MTTTRLPAKLSRPRLFDALPRERLFAQLDAHAQRPLTWVTGPPGAGKTTLVTSYLATKRTATLWYRVDDGDADAATVFSYLAQGARPATRKRKLNLPALTPEYLLDLAAFTRRFFRNLFSVLPSSSALVFDSYEQSGENTLDALLAIAVEELPHGMRIFVTSRAQAPATLVYLQTKGHLASVPWEDLRLTESEAKAIGGDVQLGAVSSIATLHALCDGWAAGFVAMLQHARRTTALAPLAANAMRESLFGYFVNEMFARADEATREMLMRTALMPAFTQAEAQALCESESAGDIVQRLYRQHYFIDRSAGAAPVYRYHALFQDFLREQGQVQWSIDERNRLLTKAAQLLEAGGRAEEALGIYTEAGSWENAARVVCMLAPGLIGSGRYAALDKAITALPQGVMEAAPWLLYWLGMARLPFNPPAGRNLLEAAYEKFEAGDESTGCALCAAGMIYGYQFEWSDVTPIDRWAKAFALHSRREGAFPSIELEIRALTAFVVLFFRCDVHADFIDKLCERAGELLPQANNLTLRITLANFLGWVMSSRGEFAELRKLESLVQVVGHGSDLPPDLEIYWLLCLSWTGHQQADFEKSFRAIARAESLAKDHGIHAFDVVVASHGAQASANSGDLSRLAAYHAKMQATVNPNRTLDAADFDYISSVLALARHETEAALRFARASLQKTIAAGATLLTANCRVPLAHTLLQIGDKGAALVEAQHIIDYASSARQWAVKHAGLMLKADALRGLQRYDEALGILREALEMAREGEFVVIFPWAPTPFMQRVYSWALDENVESGYVSDLIKKLKIPAPEGAADTWPWPVRIYTLGRFGITLDNNPLEFGRKQPKRPLALLKFLIARRGQARVELAIDALWGDEEADAAANSLDVALHRLRRLLGGADRVDLQDGLLTLDRRSIWVDAFAFENALEPAKGDSGNLTEDRQRAIALYRGWFLATDVAEPWAVAARERLHARFVQAVMAQGKHLQRQNEHAAAAAHYARAIDIDELTESFYQDLMQCQLALGRRSEGLATYERLKKVLAAELGVAPAGEIERIRRALV